MTQQIRVPTEIYKRLESHATGFDTPANVIERLLNHYEGVEPEMSIIPVNVKKKDTTKYKFNGTVYGKSRLVLAVMAAYVEDNVGIDLTRLYLEFPKEIQGSIGVFNELGAVQEKYSNKANKRHFVKDGDLISVGQDYIVVCTEWGAGNIDNFIEKMKQLNYDISPITL